MADDPTSPAEISTPGPYAGGAGAPAAGGAASGGAATDGGAGAAASQEWHERAAEFLESSVGLVRTKTVVPLTKIGQILIFAMILTVAGAALLALLIIALLRLTQAYLPLPHARAVWVSYVGIGAIFVLAGAFFMRKRRQKPAARQE